ncbi:MAG: amidophosphoribosyltransferase, partial [Bacteroidetes bacterium]
MSDFIGHECGIALIRLRKPLSYFIERYGTPTYGINKLYLLMEKQHNRGQDGAGVANLVIDQRPGFPYLIRQRSTSNQPLVEIFEKLGSRFNRVQRNQKTKYKNSQWLKENVPFAGEVFLGHLRYGTHGKNALDFCHPFIRRSNWRSRNLALAGNFNMTNVDELFDQLISFGQHPKEKTDTITVLEKIGHFLDVENLRLWDEYQGKGFTDHEIALLIEDELNMQTVLKRACKGFDGGYAMIGIIGNGTSFVARDPAGIRPAYYYANDEVIVI